MYRDPKAVPMTACARCRVQVAQSETFFTTEGELVCVRCHGVENAHAQVERARDAAYENAGRGVVGMMAQVEADNTAFRDHGEIQAIAGNRPGGAAPLASSPEARCDACGNVVPRLETTYAPSGALVCRPCEAVLLAAMAQARVAQRRTALIGFAIAGAVGLLLLIGVILINR